MNARVTALPVLLVACAASAPPPRPPPSQCAAPPAEPAAATEPAPAPIQSSAPPPVVACLPLHSVTPEFARTPHFNLGNTRVYLARCMEPGGSADGDGASEDKACGQAKRATFETCTAASVGGAISVASFVSKPPPVGARVEVRGRLGLSGPRPADAAATLGLISGRDYHDMCVMLNLTPSGGGPADLWRCSSPSGSGTERTCCNESAARPATGVDIVVRGTVKRLLVGPTAEIHALADLEAGSFCVIRGTK